VHVAIFTDNDFDKINGVTTTLTEVLRRAPPHIVPRIYTADTRGADRPDYLALRSVSVPIPYYGEMKMYVPHIGEYIRRARADAIDVIHLTTPGPIGLAAVRVARALELPIVGTFHTDLAAYTTLLSGSRWLGTLMRGLLRWIYGQCDRILVPSEATRRIVAETTGDDRGIGLCPRGVDETAFSPAHRSERLRAEWQVSDARPALLYVGRVSREKGLVLLPALQRQLRARGLPHRWIIAGHGPMHAELTAQLSDAVFTGALNRQQVAEAFASADIFVFPSRTDTAGNVVLEAQASGLPVFVSDAGGPRENMLPDRTGCVVSGTGPEAWADALIPAIRDPGWRRHVGLAARRFALSRTWDAALEPLYAAYGDVLLEESPRASRLPLLRSVRSADADR
jgi:glycosyltransferase involved in cell wall biosynthesis